MTLIQWQRCDPLRAPSSLSAPGLRCGEFYGSAHWAGRALGPRRLGISPLRRLSSAFPRWWHLDAARAEDAVSMADPGLRAGRAGWLRAVVLGADDGLVS